MAGFVFGAGSLVFAANIWQGTDTLQDGQIISSETIRDNFDYLYNLFDTIPVCNGENQALGWDGSGYTCETHSPALEIPACMGENSKLAWDGTDWICETNDPWLVFRLHTKDGCRAIGGEVVADSADRPFCRLSRNSCPAGWNQHENWTETSSRACAAPRHEDSSCGDDGRCTMGSHGWANSRVESCTATGYWEGGGGASSPCEHSRTTTCNATVNKIGCY